MNPLVMPFPTLCRKTLLAGYKTLTYRVSTEQGKYVAGQSYEAVGYDGEVWGVSLKVLSVEPIQVSDLPGRAQRQVLRDAPEAKIADKITFTIS